MIRVPVQTTLHTEFITDYQSSALFLQARTEYLELNFSVVLVHCVGCQDQDCKPSVATPTYIN